jgi:peptidyl-prolyl cis-trans isomerase C
MIKKILYFLYALTFATSSFSEEKEVRVNDKFINKNLIHFIKNEVMKEGIEVTDDMEKNIVKRLIDLELIYQQAKKEGLTSQTEFLSKSELAFKELIYTTFLQNFIKQNKITKNEIKASYDNLVSNFNKNDYKARHILVSTKNKANSIIKSLKKGGDFKELASLNSIDKESKNNGGDLGWFAADDMVESFSNAIKKLSVNEVTNIPIQSQFGWHIIQLNEIKPSLPPPLDEKIDDIKIMLQKLKLKKYLDELRLTADIKKEN